MARLAPPLVLICFLAVLATAAPANAATTRAEYSADVNDICVTEQREAQRISDKYFDLIIASPNEDEAKRRKINVKKAMRFWGNLYGEILRLDARTNDALAAVTPAPGDEITVAAWVEAMRQVNELARPAIAATMKALRFLYRASPYTGDDDGDMSRGERRKLKVHQRKIKKLSGPPNNRQSLANRYAVALGANECLPNASLRLAP